MVAKFRKKPVEVEAIRYTEDNIHEVMNFFDEDGVPLIKKSLMYDPSVNKYYIRTLEGNVYVDNGDWIVKGVAGEFYPVKNFIFEQTYEKV